MENNVQKMREALEKCRHIIHCSMVAGILRGDDVIRAFIVATDALAAPAKNFDIGTAEEQYERWRAFCDKYDDDCTGCPFEGHPHCFPEWAQMPYEPDTKKEERNDAE